MALEGILAKMPLRLTLAGIAAAVLLWTAPVGTTSPADLPIVDTAATAPFLEENASVILRKVDRFYGIRIMPFAVDYADSLSVPGALMDYCFFTDTMDVDTGKAYPLRSLPAHYHASPDTCQILTLEGVFIHELGHVYTNQVMRGLKKEKLLGAGQGADSAALPQDLLDEGIADYFGIRMGQLTPATTDRAWPDSIGQFWEYSAQGDAQIYGYGYRLVRPILDSLGVAAGVRAILSAPIPSQEELFDPSAYQRRVLAEGRGPARR